MRKFIFACLILAPSAQAQVFECPKFYPWQDTVMSEVPYQHRGKGIVQKAELSGAGAFLGDFNGNMQIAPADVKKIKGGSDSYFMPAKWLVCDYGNGISWWEELKLDENKVQSCVLQVRNKQGRDPMDIKLVCK
jgi:hypothetical protein